VQSAGEVHGLTSARDVGRLWAGGWQTRGRRRRRRKHDGGQLRFTV